MCDSRNLKINLKIDLNDTCDMSVIVTKCDRMWQNVTECDIIWLSVIHCERICKSVREYGKSDKYDKSRDKCDRMWHVDETF